MQFQTYTWSDIQAYLAQIRPQLATELQAFVPENDSIVHLATYSYGELIIKQGRGPWPVGILLTRAAEQFVEHTPYTLPLAVLQPGQSLGLPYYLQHEHYAYYDICAGARSLCLLPPLAAPTSASASLFHTERPPVQTENQDDVAVFTHLLRQHPSQWHCEVLWFEHSWLGNPAFQHYLCRYAGEQQATLPTSVTLALAECLQQHPQLAPEVSATLQHILNLAYGIFPGFRPAAGEEKLAPTLAIQRALVSTYRLPFLPTLMVPCSINQHPIIYYSCHRPSLLYPGVMPPLGKKHLHQIMQLFTQLQHHLAINQFMLPDITCYYPPAQRSGKLQSSFVLSDIDKAFVAEKKLFPNLPFCQRAPFLKSVIRIKRTEF